uniref:ABC transporter permease n=1 Tax=candidate division WOR-3 bacterium TaxID=2052148 RepID=A0A7C3URS6_UNCW3
MGKLFSSLRETLSFLGETILELRNLFLYQRETKDALLSFALGSLPLILFVSIFVGFSTAASALYISLPGTPPYLIGSGIFKGVILEIEPVLLGLLLVGRIGAGIASEIGSMRVSDQIDALRSLGISPPGFLALPRIVAGLIASPLLLIIGYWFALLSAYLLASPKISAFEFLRGIKTYFEPKEVYIGITKAILFGLISTFFGSYFGLLTKEGAKGVGYYTMLSVVVSSLFILFVNYIVNLILL